MANIKKVVNAAKKHVEEEKKIKEKAQKMVDASKKKKRGRPVLYDEAVAKERQKASKRKYNARRAAMRRVEKARAAYQKAYTNFRASISASMRDIYSDHSGPEWDTFCETWGSDISKYINKYSYDSDNVLDVLQQEKAGYGELQPLCQALLELDGINDDMVKYEEAESQLQEAIDNQVTIFLKTLEQFL